MLEVKIDIVPFGEESRRRTIEKFVIINSGKHKKRPEYGEYVVHHEGDSFVIKNHKRAHGAWSLVKKCINKYLMERKHNESH